MMDEIEFLLPKTSWVNSPDKNDFKISNKDSTITTQFSLNDVIPYLPIFSDLDNDTISCIDSIWVVTH